MKMSAYGQKKIDELLEELSSDSPVPGGGAIAALSDAIANALTEMVCNLTITKKFYKELPSSLQEDIQHIKENSKVHRNISLDFMKQDVEAFSNVMNAFKLAKETEEEKDIRQEAIQNSYLVAMSVPMEVAKQALITLQKIKLLVEHGNPNCITDAAVGASMAYAAIEGALLNVRINLQSMKDNALVNEKKEELHSLFSKAKELKIEIDTLVDIKLG